MNPAAQTGRALRRELVVALLLIWLPWFLLGSYWRQVPGPRTLGLEFMMLALEAADIVLILYLLRRNGESLRHLGIHKVRWWVELLWAAGIYVVAWLSWLLLDRLLVDLFGEPAETLGPQKPNPGLDTWLLPFFLIVSAIFEELFVRGYLGHRLGRITGSRLLAVVLSTLLFTAYHSYPLRDLTYIFVFGLVLGGFYGVGRSLPRLILAHTFFNLSIYFNWT